MDHAPTNQKRRISDATSPTGNRSLQPERIPLEVWWHIIEDSGLARADIQNLGLTNKFLAWVTQPLLFRTFKYTVTRALEPRHGQEMLQGPSTDHVIHLAERLQLATSARIARGVRSVMVVIVDATTLEPRASSESQAGPHEDLVNAETLVDQVFDVLSCFPSLNALHVERVDITPQRIDRLAALSTLQGLHIVACPASGQLVLPRLQLRQLSLKGGMGGTLGCYLQLLRAPTLEQFSFHAPANPDPTVVEPVLTALAEGPVMRSLRTLHLSRACYRSSNFVPALRQCPNLEELYIPNSARFDRHHRRPAHDGTVVLAPLPLRKLRAIRAPFEVILRCAEGLPVRHISVDIAHLLNVSNLSALFSNSRTQFAELEEISIHVTSTTVASILSLVRRFQQLKGIYIEVKRPDQPVTREVSTLCARESTVTDLPEDYSKHQRRAAPEHAAIPDHIMSGRTSR